MFILGSNKSSLYSKRTLNFRVKNVGSDRPPSLLPLLPLLPTHKTTLTHPIPVCSIYHSACSRIINPVRLHILHDTNSGHHQLDCVWWILHGLHQRDVRRFQGVQCSNCICRVVQEPVTILCAALSVWTLASVTKQLPTATSLWMLLCFASDSLISLHIG